MLAPFLIGMAILEFVPALLYFPVAFTSYNALQSPTFVGLDNFREMLADRVFWIATGNSLFFVAIAVPLRLGGALLLAMLLAPNRRGTAAYRAAVYLPTIVPDIAWAIAWLWIFNPLYGPLNGLLQNLGLPAPAMTIGEWPPRIAIALILVFQLGEGFVVCLASLSDIPRDLTDQARVDGGTAWQTFTRIIAPIIAPTLLVLLLRDCIFSLQANFVPAIVIGRNGGPDYATTYLPNYIYTEAFTYLRFGYAAALTWIMFILTGVILFVLYKTANRLRFGFGDDD